MVKVSRRAEGGGELLALPDVRQVTSHTCGPAALRSILRYFGITPPSEAKLAREMGTTAKLGTDPDQIAGVARKYGLEVETESHLTLAHLEACVRQGRPVLVTYQAWSGEERPDWKRDWAHGHYSVVSGIDAECVYLEDPILVGSIGFIPRREFLDRWHDTDRHDRKLVHLGMTFWRPGFVPRSQCELAAAKRTRID